MAVQLAVSDRNVLLVTLVESKNGENQRTSIFCLNNVQMIHYPPKMEDLGRGSWAGMSDVQIQVQGNSKMELKGETRPLEIFILSEEQQLALNVLQGNVGAALILSDMAQEKHSNQQGIGYFHKEVEKQTAELKKQLKAEEKTREVLERRINELEMTTPGDTWGEIE